MIDVDWIQENKQDRNEHISLEGKPHAVKALLQYLYTFEYSQEESNYDGPAWCFYLDVAETANQYLVKELEEHAYDKYRLSWFEVHL